MTTSPRSGGSRAWSRMGARRALSADRADDAVLSGAGRLDELRRSERTMVIVRWAGVAFGLLQVLAYGEAPYPPGIFPAALAAVGILAAGTVAAWWMLSRVRTLTQVRALAMGSLAFDIVVAEVFVWLYAFDQGSALWAVLFVLPLEGAHKFRLSGALGAWGGVTVLYALREVWASGRYDYPLLWNSITFRMGIGLLIALVAGMMARNLTQQRELLGNALSELRRVDSLRSALISTMAHDVRGPLTAIRGSLKMLLGHRDRLDQHTQDELLATADRQAGRLERLAGDLLDLARLERGRLELSLEDVPLAESIRTALSYVDRDGEVEVEADPEVVVRADPARLEQIVVNLAANSLRYGDAPYVIEARARDGLAEVVFRDHGPGVPPAQIGALFEPFRLERERTSVGFGLAIVKALAEAHGGSVGYAPNRPQGACFTVTLPLRGPEPAE